MTALDLPKKVWDFAREKALLQVGDRVIVALSGGADSVTLLHVLCGLRDAADLTVAAVHVHHGLRGADADADEALCRRLCEQWDVPLSVHHIDVAAEAASAHETIEQTGRRLRYACLEREADKQNAKIATAHTASDQAETVLLHLTRGCGLHGLCGIPPRRGGVIRPLLTCSREQVEAYCAAQGLAFATDATNADVTYARNRVRHRVLPELTEINPRVGEALCRLSEQLADRIRNVQVGSGSRSQIDADGLLVDEDHLFRTLLHEAVHQRALAGTGHTCDHRQYVLGQVHRDVL